MTEHQTDRRLGGSHRRLGMPSSLRMREHPHG